MGRNGNSRDVILETAVQLASRDGLDGVSIGSLAKAVGMSKSGLLFHFGSKDRLKQMVVQHAADNFTEKVLRPAFREPRGEPRVRAIFENWLKYIEHMSELPGACLLIAASIEVDDQPGELRNLVQQVQKDLVANVEKAVRIAQDEGHFRKEVDPRRFAWELYSFVLGYHHFRRMLEDASAKAYVLDAFEELLKTARPPGLADTESRI